jgi:Recombinase-like helix-turn-helix domain
MTKDVDYNPFLSPAPADRTGRGHIADEIDAQNIVWQTRVAAPTAFERRLGDALETIFDQGIEDLAGVVRSLNAMGVTDAKGDPWTELSFQDELKRLGG